MKAPVYLGLSRLDLSKMVMYEFWYYCIKPIYGEKSKLFYMVQTVSLYTWKQIIFIKTLQKILKLDLMLQVMNYVGT